MKPSACGFEVAGLVCAILITTAISFTPPLCSFSSHLGLQLASSGYVQQHWDTLLSPVNHFSWNNGMGEADKAFRRGDLLDKSGQPRAASAAFHEAATLLQCFLDLESSFGHVTRLDKEDAPAALSYILTRLGFLNTDALGDPNAAIRLYTLATTCNAFPSAVSFKSLGNALEAAGGNEVDLSHIEKAAAAYTEATNLSQEPTTEFCLAVALERLGRTKQADTILESLQRTETPVSCLVDSWGYVRWHTRKVLPAELNLYRGTRDMLELGLDTALPLIEQQRQNRVRGLVCDFGSDTGRSLRMMQEILPLDIRINGFHSTTKLPQAGQESPIPSYSTGGAIPKMEGDCVVHSGGFRDTIPALFDGMQHDAFIAFANFACDNYTSTTEVLESLHGRLQRGSILVFNDYIFHPTWRQDQFRAWRESCKRFGWKYEYLGFSLATKQAIVRLTDV